MPTSVGVCRPARCPLHARALERSCLAYTCLEALFVAHRHPWFGPHTHMLGGSSVARCLGGPACLTRTHCQFGSHTHIRRPSSEAEYRRCLSLAEHSVLRPPHHKNPPVTLSPQQDSSQGRAKPKGASRLLPRAPLATLSPLPEPSPSNRLYPTADTSIL